MLRHRVLAAAFLGYDNSKTVASDADQLPLLEEAGLGGGASSEILKSSVRFHVTNEPRSRACLMTVH